MPAITAGPATADGATARIIYPLPRLEFAADGSYSVYSVDIPATLYRAGGLIYARLDYSPTNEIVFRVHPHNRFSAE